MTVSSPEPGSLLPRATVFSLAPSSTRLQHYRQHACPSLHEEMALKPCPSCPVRKPVRRVWHVCHRGHTCAPQSCPCETESSRGPEDENPLVYSNSLTSPGRYEFKVMCLRGSSGPQRPRQKDHGHREKGLSFQSEGRSLTASLP